MKKLTVLFLSIVSVAAMMTSCLTPEQKIEKNVAKANKECPVEMGNGMTMVSMVIEDNNVITTCEVNEETLGMSIAIWNTPEVYNAMKKSVTDLYRNGEDKDVAALTNMCKEANYNIIFRFLGKPSGEKVEFTINADEL